MEKKEYINKRNKIEEDYKEKLKILDEEFLNNNGEYYEMIKEYPNTLKVGDKFSVHGGVVNFVKTVLTLENKPTYEDLLDKEYFKRIPYPFE